MRERPVIMVVEDDVEMNELECELLRLHGLEPVPAYSGREAIETNRDRDPDVILMDIMLPEMDGFEACRQLRDGQATRRMSIVIVTALDSEDCRRRGYEVGADAYFTKPFDPDEVVGTIQSLLAGNGQHVRRQPVS